MSARVDALETQLLGAVAEVARLTTELARARREDDAAPAMPLLPAGAGDEEPEEYLTTQQAAERYNIRLSSLYTFLKRRDDPIPRWRSGRMIRIPRRGLEAWLERQTQKTLQNALYGGESTR